MHIGRWGPIVVAMFSFVSCARGETGRVAAGIDFEVRPVSSSTADEEAPTVAGNKTHGPFVSTFWLQAAAWSGGLVWLTDQDGRLFGIDGDSGEIVIDRQLDHAVSWPDGLTDADQELWGLSAASDGVQALRINTDTGEVRAVAVDQGRPLGQSVCRGATLVVADYDRGIVALDPYNGTTRLLADPGVIPNLVHFAPDDTYWVVDDNRERLLRVDARGKHLVDSHRQERKPATTVVGALVADETGNAWLAERTAVVAMNPAGETILEVSGFTNATALLTCDGAVVASDVETGELAWLDAAGREDRLATGESGLAVACAPDGVWFLTTDGYLGHVAEPRR